MKIEQKNQKDIKKFFDLEEGDLFRIGKLVLMRVEDHKDYYDRDRNCINLSTGALMYVGMEKDVEIVRAKLVVE